MPKQDPSLDNKRREIELESRRLIQPSDGDLELVSYNVTDTDITGEKRFTEQEFVAIYSKVRGCKNFGSYDDFVRCLEMWDREKDGSMPLADLEHALTKMGERLTEEELEVVMRDCVGPEDEDGNIRYIPFLDKICEKSVLLDSVRQN